MLIERAPGDPKSRDFGSHTLWHRCHVEADAPSLLESAERQLKQRIQDDLHLSRVGDLSLGGTIWSPKERERKHLGIAFVSALEDGEIAESLSTKEFRRGARAPHHLRTEL